MNKNIEILHEGNFSCVISNKTERRTFTQRGVADLYDLYKQEPEFLKEALVADKVVGKAAAALMILSGVKHVYADIISESALTLLKNSNVEIDYSEKVSFIENRDKTGWCPLEKMTYEEDSTDKIFVMIENFISNMRSKKSV